MREKIAAAIASFIFMAVIPVVVTSIIPHIDPAVGWPVVGASILVGITVLIRVSLRTIFEIGEPRWGH